MGVLIGLVIAAAYLTIGWRYVAPRYVTRAMARQFEQFRSLAGRPGEVASWRRWAAGEGAALGLVWPVYLAWRLLTGGIAEHAPLCHAEAEQKIAERDGRIAELERELRIGR